MPPFGRIRIDVVELRKLWRIFEIAESRDAVQQGAFRSLRTMRKRRNEHAGAEPERLPPRQPSPYLPLEHGDVAEQVAH